MSGLVMREAHRLIPVFFNIGLMLRRRFQVFFVHRTRLHVLCFHTFEELPAGGSVRIKTPNPEALKGVHEFLRFQIEDHHTGDTTEIGTM